MSDKNEIEKIPTERGSIFLSGDAFEHAQRVSLMLSKSALVPTTFQNKVENCMIALEMAQRIGASPLMVMQNMDIIHGRPSWRSQFLIATFNTLAKYSNIDYEEDKKEGGRIRAIATNLDTGKEMHGVWVSMNMAKAEGWIAKNGSKWKTMPHLMMRYRAAAFFVRQFAPEVAMGLMTQEEASDVGPPKVEEAKAEVVVEKKKAINDKKAAAKKDQKGEQGELEMP